MSEAKELPKIKLFASSTERQNIEQMADLYSIIKATQHLETAYTRDAVSEEKYTEACKGLINKFKTLKAASAQLVPNIDKFISEYRMECKAARHRLLRVGVPATVEFGSGSSAGKLDQDDQKHVFEAVQTFITTQNCLELEMRDVDQLHPNLSDLMASLNKVKKLPEDHLSKVKVKDWLVKLNEKPASYRLNDDELRQMRFDLQTAYDHWHRIYK
mmetsp:Transcript_24706/g.59459  ORF Transcript_24706/g.59459 Transcript_24706/m.59459 type:complete len:215 (-) Transcript_24706:260-904(-)|eukprot:CAMPEP_0114517468 /NCGR_PEP_ID=MMETSP0109-20121206/17908_1 /TAXON_ID=29199 /ORGANISM="Chlorarachnion reptans, Strain CCCM449" /LENGTH=214 /DNA_ID=CAMNT_0001697987 /DNA_START=137 /DNA_END=781 /DNA_ORIENTATION=-